MMTSTLRSMGAVFGAVVLSVALGGLPAFAQTATCPFFTGKKVDGWFAALPPSADATKQVLLCVDDPGFTTFDYLDRSATSSSMYIDLMYQTTARPARGILEASPETDDLTETTRELTNAEADACRAEIVRSQTWSALGCPNN